MVVGAILWIVGGSQLGQDQSASAYAQALELDNGLSAQASTPQVDLDTALIWWGIAVLVLGVLLVLARLIIAASRRPS